ncbi:hypothetical protein N7510_002549 [Penicillium lagena]|uniref:uncharacterized protein n=1 Tax=Penicillium lagena TaxID=94218 RepID=UPI002540610E|nr:uncharacterized protein N7510_002549 [Penicillium lagena]KAJ5626240.1 hypothetical protein N7510_002549 [Penicillium lagena]
MVPESPKRDGDSTQFLRARKRAKYTQVAWSVLFASRSAAVPTANSGPSNECKRRKLKCSGGTVCARCARDQVSCVYATTQRTPGTPMEPEVKDESVSTRFEAVDHNLATLQREVRNLSARLLSLESTSPGASSRPPAAPAASLHRILNPPKSPSYVGPTSAEFGLSRPHRSHPHEDDPADDEGPDEDIGLSTAIQSPAPSENEDALATGDPLDILGLEETLRLVRVYEDTVGVMYPCVDLSSVRAYVRDYFRFHHPETSNSHSSKTTADRDWFSARDIQVLKILLATALLAESHGRSERAAQLADSVEDRFASRLKISEVDMKEILILTLLAIFHAYRDDEVIAWRLTGMAARGSMELGLHCQETWQKTDGVFPGELEKTWASRLFWCIYVLDRKWSFGTGLPFAIQDSDMDTDLPEPGSSTPYLTCMISYARLSTKIWGLVTGWQSRSREATSDGCAYLDAQVQQWIRSIPHELRFDPTWRSPVGSEHTDRTMMLQVLLALQANQLRILVYRQNLLSSERIAEDMAGATTAVETAKSTVQMLDCFSRVSNVYFQRPEPFNYFLISALAALFLAVLHAPARFSHVCRPEFYTAVDMVRRSATRARTSRRLQKIIRSLKRIQLNVHGDNMSGRRHSGHDAGASSAKPIPHPDSHLTSRPNTTPTAWESTPVSASTQSPSAQCTPTLYQTNSFPTPQPPGGFWPMSPGTVGDAETNGCEDLSSFFEIAGGLYFDPGGGTDLLDVGMSHPNDSRLPNALDAFHAEDEALTRVMAGLL